MSVCISLIAAVSENGVIGRENKLPWNIPDDLKYFRRVTSGHPVIMGRKTYESIGRPLPNRQNIVITRQKEFHAPGADVVQSVDQALLKCDPNAKEVFIIGGAEIYRETLPRANRIYLTLVHRHIEGDAHFPELEPDLFDELSREDHMNVEVPFSFLVWERK